MSSLIDQRRRCFKPSIPSMQASLPDLAESVNNSCLDLAQDLTIENVDLALGKVKAAAQNLYFLRQAMLFRDSEAVATSHANDSLSE